MKPRVTLRQFHGDDEPPGFFGGLAIVILGIVVAVVFLGYALGMGGM